MKLKELRERLEEIEQNYPEAAEADVRIDPMDHDILSVTYRDDYDTVELSH